MLNHEVSEYFISIEGEGPYTGHATVYVRYAKCNLKCAGFNNPNNEIDSSGYAILGFNPKDYKTLQQLPPIVMGCDSQYSVSSTFSHMWERLDTTQLAEKLVNLLPYKSWIHPVTGQPVIFSLTGGEPTLRQKQIPALLEHPLLNDCRHILIETNCSVPIRPDFITALSNWTQQGKKVTFANSPKLGASGELWEDAIKPEVAVAQQQVAGSEQYFKFVCGNSDKDFDEVARVMQAYWDAGVQKQNNVLIMPMACNELQQDDIASQVAIECIERGYTFCYRVHVPVFANKIGT